MSIVKWLIDKLEIFATEEEMNIIDQAEEMYKQQIIEAANQSAKEAYRAGQNSMYCGCYDIDGCTTYEEWICSKITKPEEQ